MSQRLHNGGGPQIPVSLSPLGCVLRGRGEAQDSGISKVMAHFCIENPNAVTPRPGPREDICAWDSGHGKPAQCLNSSRSQGPGPRDTSTSLHAPSHPQEKMQSRAQQSQPPGPSRARGNPSALSRPRPGLAPGPLTPPEWAHSFSPPPEPGAFSLTSLFTHQVSQALSALILNL